MSTESPDREDRTELLARLAAEAAAACGVSWEYAAVVVHLGDGLPDLVPVVVRTAAPARTPDDS